MPTDLSICFIATAWGTKHGGINALNYELACAIAALGIRAICAVPSAQRSDIEDAASRHVVLLATNTTPEEIMSRTVVDEVAARAKGSPIYWVGHDAITGHQALEARDLTGPESFFALIHHMNYIAYKGLEGVEAPVVDSRHALQRHLLESADFVFAVGPKLYSSAMDILRASDAFPSIVLLIPGLHKVDQVPPPAAFCAFFAGRLSGPATRIKQPYLAVAAFAQAINQFPSQLGLDPRITLMGLDDAHDGNSVRERLNEIAYRYASRRVNIMAMPYANNRDQFFERLAGHSAALMLSLHEGFGLSAWEAVAAGVPLILSQNSGIYQFISNTLGGAGRGCVRAVDIRGGRDLDEPEQADISCVADHIQSIAGDPIRARTDARSLRSQLSQYTWQAAAETVLSALLGGRRSEGAPVTFQTGGTPAASGEPTLNTIAFDVYTDASAPFYLERTLDSDVAQFLNGSSLWLHGPSASGKTSAIRHCLENAKRRAVYICLAHMYAAPVAEWFDEIYLSIVDQERDGGPPFVRSASVSAALLRLSDALADESRTNELVLHIDEVPVDGRSDGDEFADAFSALVVDQMSRYPEARVFYALSTIEAPVQGLTAKARQKVVTLEVGNWSDTEMSQLLELLEDALKLSLSGVTREQILRAAGSSPRFLKSVLRKLVLLRGDERWPVERIIETTAGECR